MNKTITKTCLFIAFLFISAVGLAQITIKGNVTDSETGNPVDFASVGLVGTVYGTETKDGGKFEFTAPVGNYNLSVSFVGYATFTTPITASSDNQIINISLVPDVTSLEEVSILGSRRGEARTSTESAVPIDIISSAEIARTGYTQTVEILENLVPSFNAPKPSLSDGTDHVRPASLRGLGPDQTLVLINGKRRHTSAMLNVNGTFGRGSTGVDLNAIPPSAIKRIEVLRDGASAQYGSDALAGVINIVLKDNIGFDAGFTTGMNLTSYERGYNETEGLAPIEDLADFKARNINGGQSGIYDKNWYKTKEKAFIADGVRYIASLGYGFNLGSKASLYISAQARIQGKANRAGYDPRYNYFLDSAGVKQSQSEKEGFIQSSEENEFNRLNHWYGQSKTNDFSGFLNGTVKAGKSEFYYFGGANFRKSTGPCYYRRALDDRNVRKIYPNGFLPQISPTVLDLSFAAGNKGKIGKWNYDISSAIGYNDFNFRLINTLNAALGDSEKQKKEMDSGHLIFSQSTTNLDFSHGINIGLASPLSVAFGAEFRMEKYKIKAGEPTSYFPDPADETQVNAKVLDGPNKGKDAATGCQCLPGFSPKSTINGSRSNVGLYVDLETDVVKQFTIGVAGRFENYSDFGQTLTGKFSTRYEFAEGVALRGAISSGFRAPSLAQIYYTSVTTNAVNNVLTEVGQFPVGSEIAQALGAKSLKPEKSVNFSLGLAVDQGKFKFTFDYYRIAIGDRVVLGENFQPYDSLDASGKVVKNKEGNVIKSLLLRKFLKSRGVDADGGRYFTNSLNTVTHGVDIVASYYLDLSAKSKLKFSFSANLNRTLVINKDQLGIPELLKQYSNTPILERFNVSRLEEQTPKSKYNLGFDYSIGKFEAELRFVRYGSYTVVSESDAMYDQTFSPNIVTNLELKYNILQSLSLAIGSNNIFDVYPDKVYKGDSFNGVFPFSQSTPFSFLGRYTYLRMNFSLAK